MHVWASDACVWFIVWIKDIPSNLYYKSQIPKRKCFSSRFGGVVVQSIEARCNVENEDAVGATLAGDAPTASEWSTTLLPPEVQLILKVRRFNV